MTFRYSKTATSTLKILLIFIFSGGSTLLVAQPNTLYFMKGIPQTKDINPARPGITEGYYISMPLFSKIDLAANTNNWAYNDIIHKGIDNTLLNNTAGNQGWNQSDSLVVDANKFLGSLSNKNFVFESAALTVLEGGFKKGKNFYAASITEREFTEVSFNRNLVNLVVSGNYPYLGRSYYSGNFGVSAAHYREFTFNYSHDLTKKLTIGAAAKILFGMSTVHSNGLHFRATSTALGNYLDVTASGRVRLSVPVDFDYTSRGEIKKVYSLPNYTARDYMINFSNPGFAMDLGLSYHLNKKTEISASIIDLGMIGWRSNVAQFIEQGHFLYRGLSLNDPAKTPPVITVLNPLINQLSDSISAAFRPDTSVTHFATLLPVKIYFGLDYQLNDIWNLSGLTRIRIINNTIHTSLTASANTLLWNRLTLSASYSLMESTFDNLGFGAGIKAGPFQLYAATDNIVSPFYPAKARNMNLRVGINFIFDHQKRGNSGSSLNPNCHCPY